MSAYFEIKNAANSQYMFNLKGGNHETVLTSETYVSKQGAQDGIASVKVNAPIDSRYHKFTNAAGRFCFNLKAANGEIIGKSEGYDSSSNRDRAIDWVKSNAPTASTKDSTK